MHHFLSEVVQLRPDYSSKVWAMMYAQSLGEGGHTVQHLRSLNSEALLSVLEEHQVKPQHRQQIADFIEATRGAETTGSDSKTHRSDMIATHAQRAWRAELSCSSTLKLQTGESTACSHVWYVITPPLQVCVAIRISLKKTRAKI